MPTRSCVIVLAVLLAPAIARAQGVANREPQPALPPAAPSPEAAAARRANAVRAARPPVLDGRQDDPVWREAQEITQFRQFDPVEDGEPLFPTMAKVAYDARNLYVFVRAFDPHPDSIVSLLSRRDVRTESEQIKIMIDSYHDRRTGYEFAVNPAGVKRDYYMHGDYNEDDSWDAVWDVATTTDSLGWTAEFRIPLSQLRFADKETHTFGFAVWRDIARAAQRVSWPLFRRSQPGVVSQLGEVGGISGIGTGRRLEIAPYVVTKNVTRQSATEYTHPQEFAAGVDVKAGVTSNLTLDATINPDFGQVESDPAQFNLSSTESFFDERRPFFLEGTGIFNFNLSCNDGNCSGLFYSRRIGRSPRLRGSVYEDPASPDVTTILGAAKVTGRLGSGLSLGVLNAVTDREEERDPLGGGAATIEPMSNYFVGRLQQDFREGKSGVGLMATAVNRRLDAWTEGSYRRAGYAIGFDGRHRFAKDWQVSGYVVGSEVQGTETAIAELQTCGGAFGCVHNYTRPDDDLEFDPTRTLLRGASMQIGLEDQGGGWRGSMYYTRTTPGFEINDVGFNGGDDTQSFSNWWQRRWETPTTWYRRVFVNFNQWTSGTTSGLLTDLGGNVNAHIEFANRWWIHSGFNYNNWTPVYCERNCTRGGPALKQSAGDIYSWVGVESDFRKPVAFWANVEYGREDEGNSHSWWMGPGMTFRIASRLQGRVNGSLFLNRDDEQYYDTFGDPEAGPLTYTVARLEQRTVAVTTRLDFTASPTLSLQFYGQPFVTTGEYSDVREVVDPRAARYDDRYAPYATGDPGGFDYKQFRSNTVLRWEYRPGSTLFLVWAQGRTSDDAFEEFNLRRSTRRLFERHPDNTFLVKASYWFNP